MLFAVRTTRRILARSLWAWLLAGLSLSTALEIHPAGESLESSAAGLTLAVPETGHPVTSTHVEAAFSLDIPACPACLLRTQTRGVRLIPVAGLAAPQLAERIAVVAPRAPERRFARPRAARAPPLA